MKITSKTSNILSFIQELLHNFWQNTVKILSSDYQELEVIQKVDRKGNIYWQAYDPISGKSYSSGSEVDVCMWIEQLYR
ncbi:hypothetical protein H6G41_08770 [Tolypothrix sp. FACHB-123]|nr:hypothetical protein [Tolypothrix sp. FACHB-123]